MPNEPRMVIITKCNQCGYCEPPDWCRKVGHWIDEPLARIIPDWCPLPKVPEGRAMTDQEQEAAAMKAAREFVNGPRCHRGFPQALIEHIAALILRECDAAVEAAHPEIEREATITALEWALEWDIELPSGLIFPDGARIVDRLATLRGLNSQSRPITKLKGGRKP